MLDMAMQVRPSFSTMVMSTCAASMPGVTTGTTLDWSSRFRASYSRLFRSERRAKRLPASRLRPLD
jgi:hypothetical protein